MTDADCAPLLAAWREFAVQYAEIAPKTAARFTRLADQLAQAQQDAEERGKSLFPEIGKPLPVASFKPAYVPPKPPKPRGRHAPAALNRVKPAPP